MSEQVLDKETWPQEAEAAMRDIRKHVKRAALSTRLRSCDQRVYINITTLEDIDYCVEMSALGFKIVGVRYDDTSLLNCDNYETPYAMLDSVSKKFRKSFGMELIDRLSDLVDSDDDN